MKKRHIILIIIAVVLIGSYYFIHSGSGNNSEVINSTAIEQSDGTESSAEAELTFRTQDQLEDHYEKHGKEMGFSSPEEYVKAANAVINSDKALHKLEKEDGDDVYYIEDTNEFVVVSSEGYIRTYFNPSDGLDYYNRQ